MVFRAAKLRIGVILFIAVLLIGLAVWNPFALALVVMLLSFERPIRALIGWRIGPTPDEVSQAGPLVQWADEASKKLNADFVSYKEGADDSYFPGHLTLSSATLAAPEEVRRAGVAYLMASRASWVNFVPFLMAGGTLFLMPSLKTIGAYTLLFGMTAYLIFSLYELGAQVARAVRVTGDEDSVRDYVARVRRRWTFDAWRFYRWMFRRLR